MTEETKGWTPERRAAQRERILKNKPWEKSTGPRTAEGKAISCLNAYLHGDRSDAIVKTAKYFVAYKEYLKNIRHRSEEDRQMRKLAHEMLRAIELIELKSKIRDLSKSLKKS